MKKPVALVVIDGFGISEEVKGNAVKAAKMPYFDYLLKTYPHCKLGASGLDVGLKAGQMGNSEVGHLNIGAGRIVSQDMTRIDNAIEDGSFFENAALKKLMEELKKTNGNLHVMGLMSDGGIHSHINHLFAVMQMAKTFGIKKVLIHFFSDGRDTDVHSAIGFAEQIENKIKEIGIGQIATVGGRFYGMDRELKYDRIKKHYDAIVFGMGENFDSAKDAIQQSYNNNVTDEFIMPCTIGNYKQFLPCEKDGFVFINFRKDRTKQITDALTTTGFNKFETKCRFKNYVCMTKYGNFEADVAFKFRPINNSLSEVVSKNGLLQAKFSEPTKYAHVTYFLNGGIEDAFKGEDRFKIPPKNVNTFDEAPEMSAVELAEKFKEVVEQNKYDFLMCNLANCDMVGHTGNFDATVIALETVDKALKIICNSVLEAGGELIVTADHGNCEKMLNENGTICTTHTNNPVWCIYVGSKKVEMQDGRLADLSPTILSLLGIEYPKEYTGKNLLKK
ncbi:MAG TPA: 2,3-bisphosphoglycerate-independent phosphoglycerate mutase [Clostridiales bacterium]|nr:2,3-bisphosphoglycerate-independent phosphoglycerate mutase [Clostridiales bacterium]